MDIPFFKKKDDIRSDTLVGITEYGRKEVEKYTSGGDDFEILSSLHDRTPQTIGNLMKDTQMPYSTLVARLKIMSKDPAFISFQSMS